MLRTHTHAHARTHAHAQACPSLLSQKKISKKRPHEHACTHAQTHAQTHTHTHTHTHIHTHTHTHTGVLTFENLEQLNHSFCQLLSAASCVLCVCVCVCIANNLFDYPDANDLYSDDLVDYSDAKTSSTTPTPTYVYTHTYKHIHTQGEVTCSMQRVKNCNIALSNTWDHYICG
jgi:hypothetical protein